MSIYAVAAALVIVWAAGTLVEAILTAPAYRHLRHCPHDKLCDHHLSAAIDFSRPWRPSWFGYLLVYSSSWPLYRVEQVYEVIRGLPSGDPACCFCSYRDASRFRRITW